MTENISPKPPSRNAGATNNITPVRKPGTPASTPIANPGKNSPMSKNPAPFRSPKPPENSGYSESHATAGGRVPRQEISGGNPANEPHIRPAPSPLRSSGEGSSQSRGSGRGENEPPPRPPRPAPRPLPPRQLSMKEAFSMLPPPPSPPQEEVSDTATTPATSPAVDHGNSSPPAAVTSSSSSSDDYPPADNRTSTANHISTATSSFSDGSSVGDSVAISASSSVSSASDDSSSGISCFTPLSSAASVFEVPSSEESLHRSESAKQLNFAAVTSLPANPQTTPTSKPSGKLPVLKRHSSYIQPTTNVSSVSSVSAGNQLRRPTGGVPLPALLPLSVPVPKAAATPQLLEPSSDAPAEGKSRNSASPPCSPRPGSLVSPRPSSPPRTGRISPRLGKSGSQIRKAAQRWIDAAPREVWTDLDNTEIQRQEAIFELITTERSYVEYLENTITLYAQPLKEKEVLSQKDYAQIFLNIDSLLSLNRGLSKDLDNLQDSKLVVEGVGNTLLKWSNQLKLYASYCANHHGVPSKIEEMSAKNKRFAAFVEEASKKPESRNLPILAHLMHPVQRVCKYPLLLQAILKHTPENHPDYAPLSEAIKAVEGVVNQINERTRQIDNFRKVEEVKNSIEKWPKGFELSELGRQFVDEVLVKVKHPKKEKTKEETMYLFSDLLLFSRKKTKSNSHTFIRMVHFKDITGIRGSEERLDIVTREDGTDMIAFPTKEAKAAFQTNLLHTLKSFREKDISEREMKERLRELNEKAKAEKAAAAAAAAEDLKNPRSGSGGTLRTPRPVTGIGSMAIAAAAVAQSNASALNNHTSPSARTPLTSLRPETDSRTRKLSVADTNKVAGSASQTQQADELQRLRDENSRLTVLVQKLTEEKNRLNAQLSEKDARISELEQKLEELRSSKKQGTAAHNST